MPVCPCVDSTPPQHHDTESPLRASAACLPFMCKRYYYNRQAFFATRFKLRLLLGPVQSVYLEVQRQTFRELYAAPWHLCSLRGKHRQVNKHQELHPSGQDFSAADYRASSD